MTLIELGSILRLEREKKNLSIDDVANHLKISARILRALECADNESLPHSVYVRGFVISYAKMLDIDTDELLSVPELYEESEEPLNSDIKFYDTGHSISKNKIIFLVFISLCLLLGGFIWMNRDADLFSKLKKDHLETAQPAPELDSSDKSQTFNDVKDTENQSKESLEKNSQISNEKNDNFQPTDNTDNEVEKENITSNTENETQGEVNTEQITVENEDNKASATTDSSDNINENRLIQEDAPVLDGTHRVIITAVAECWVDSNADNADTRQFSLQSGDTFALTFNDSLVLKLGNAGGVRIRYNGEETDIPGRVGEVKTLYFPPKQ